MITYLVIVWFTISSPQLDADITDYAVNTTLKFDSHHNCQVYTGLEATPLTVGAEHYLHTIYPEEDFDIEIREIGCITIEKFRKLEEIKNAPKPEKS